MTGTKIVADTSTFLLKFARDRDMYRSMMRERLGKYAVKLLGYCITSNHIHAVVTAPNRYGLAGFMQSLAGNGMTMEAFRENYTFCIEEAVSAQEFSREAMWSESFAVGNDRFVEEVEKSLRNRSRKEVIQPEQKKGTYILREKVPKYD